MENEKHIEQDKNNDGIDRAGFLKCMAWAGTGVLWMMSGGIMKSYGMSQMIDKATGDLKKGLIIPKADFSFVQISDSHIGFSKPANTDVVGTLQAAIAKINNMPVPPSFILHTGDLTHLAQADEFDILEQTLKSVKSEKIFYVPGEHDVTDNGKLYLERYGKGTNGDGWYSFDSHGVHFIGLVNVLSQGDGGLGVLGDTQLEWLEKDVKRLSSSTPIVVFAHVPLWAVYPQWGWGTTDSVHTAMSTAFPQPAPGSAPSPGPMKVPAEKLRSVLGLTSVNYVEHNHTLAITDVPLIEVTEKVSGQ